MATDARAQATSTGSPVPAAGARAPAAGTTVLHGRDPVIVLGEDLEDLADLTDALTSAVECHDLAGLVASNERAEGLASRIGEVSAGLTEADRERLDRLRIRGLCERIDVGVRRNAYLIERAWALDAATMRLLAGLGRTGADATLHSYAQPSAPGYVDRQA
jgi:hypothetical protein